MPRRYVVRKKATKNYLTNKTKSLVEKVALVEKSIPRVKLPEFKAGDTVIVNARIKEGDKERIQAYEGVVIGKYNRGAGKSFAVRKMSHGVGVERTFMETSPVVGGLQVVQSGKIRRAKLYYMRKLVGRAAKIERDISGASKENANKA